MTTAVLLLFHPLKRTQRDTLRLEGIWKHVKTMSYWSAIRNVVYCLNVSCFSFNLERKEIHKISTPVCLVLWFLLSTELIRWMNICYITQPIAMDNINITNALLQEHTGFGRSLSCFLKERQNITPKSESTYSWILSIQLFWTVYHPLERLVHRCHFDGYHRNTSA
jgi:hypothetical protein